MEYTSVVEHAWSFASHLESNGPATDQILRQYQSKEVVDDEVRRSIEALRSMEEIKQYFPDLPLAQKTAVFLPLNLPLYSFCLFAAMPAYQSMSLIVRPPQRMKELFRELFEALSLGKYYPNVQLFEGQREKFVADHCRNASAVLFTGQYKNFLDIQKSCSRETLILFNGVGHNPLVVTPSADLDRAVAKTVHVALYNNGQDCAGPKMIMVHDKVFDAFMDLLLRKLRQVRCANDYANDDVTVGPLFESSSLLETATLVSKMCQKGAEITYGGQFDLKHNVMHPCVVTNSLLRMQNFTEPYAPLLVIAHYEHDRDLARYFSDPRYSQHAMYISLFGNSRYVTDVQGSIILNGRTIHDIERGTTEYGGYGAGASAVAYRGLIIPKPLLIPREMYTCLSPQGREMFSGGSRIKGNWEHAVVVREFQKAVERIFGADLVFAGISGRFAREKEQRYSALDTFICVHAKHPEQVEQYLIWLFTVHEQFGRIPDFKHPANIVLLVELQETIEKLPTLELTVASNRATTYESLVQCHALSQPWIGVVHPENIPEAWKGVFPHHSPRLLDSFLSNLQRAILSGSDISPLSLEMYEIPRHEPDVSSLIKNLGDQGLENILRMVPFEETPQYTAIVQKLVAKREFIGRSGFRPEDLYNPCFRFGVVAPPPPHS